VTWAATRQVNAGEGGNSDALSERGLIAVRPLSAGDMAAQPGTDLPLSGAAIHIKPAQENASRIVG
jgi:hypothetical protein